MRKKFVFSLLLITNFFLLGFSFHSNAQQCGGVTFISKPVVSQSSSTHYVTITWNDQGEASNLSYFIVERQTGGNVITNVSAHIPKTGSATSNSYSFTDQYPYYGGSASLAYRVIWFTTDGTECESLYTPVTLSGCTTSWPGQNSCSLTTISGPNSICTSGTFQTNYSMVPSTNNPASAFTWSMSPAGIATVSVAQYDQNLITVTRNGTSSGILTLTTLAAGTCGSVTKTIVVGSPPPTSLELEDVNCPEYDFVCTPPPTTIASTWTAYNTATYTTTTLPGTTSSSKTTFNSNGSYAVCVASQDACGTSAATCINVNVTCSTGGSGGHSIVVPKGSKKSSDEESEISRVPDFTIYPNPTKNNFIIDLGVNNNEKLRSVKQVILYSSSGVAVATFNYDGLSQIVNLNVTNLSSGIYIVKVSDGIKIVSKKLLIQN